MPDTETRADSLALSDPSWHRRMLGILSRDYPDIAREVLSKSIAENYAEIQARKVGA
jgi:hypothetical protein